MKKRLLLTALTGVALAGCVSNEVDEIAQEQQQVKIMFDTPAIYGHNDSRANVNAEMTNPYSTNEEFVVYGVKHTGNFAGWSNAISVIAGETVSYNQDLNGWASSTAHFWPGGNEMMTFSAYSPADLTPYDANNDKEVKAPETKVEYGATGLKITDFKVANVVEKQFDLMFAKRAYNKTFNEGNGVYAGVPIVFQHALSSIKFMYVSESTSSEIIRLKGIELHDIYSQADFHEDITEDESDYDRYERTRDVQTGNVDPVWQLNSYEKPVDYSIFTGDKTFPNTPTDVGHAAALLLPQTLSATGTDNSNVPTLKVTYIVGQNSSEKTIEVPLAGMYASETSTTAEGEQSGTLITHWEMGKRYVYVLHYGNSQILFAPSTEDWVDVKYILINLNEAATAEEE